MKEKKLAIMKGVSFGVKDISKAGLWFSVRDGTYGSGQCILGVEALDFLERHQISDIKSLEGKPCWIELDGHIMRFLDLADI